MCSVEKETERFSKLITDGHKAFCPWRKFGCPMSFAANPFQSKPSHKLLEELHGRLHQLSRLQRLPALSKDITEKLVRLFAFLQIDATWQYSILIAFISLQKGFCSGNQHVMDLLFPADKHNAVRCHEFIVVYPSAYIINRAG